MCRKRRTGCRHTHALGCSGTGASQGHGRQHTLSSGRRSRHTQGTYRCGTRTTHTQSIVGSRAYTGTPWPSPCRCRTDASHGHALSGWLLAPWLNVLVERTELHDSIHKEHRGHLVRRASDLLMDRHQRCKHAVPLTTLCLDGALVGRAQLVLLEQVL